jgi:hypothetical protein
MKILLTTTALLMSTMLAGTASEEGANTEPVHESEGSGALVAGIESNNHADLHAHHSTQADHHVGLHEEHKAQAEHHAVEAEKLHTEASVHEEAAEAETVNENHEQAEHHVVEAEKLHTEASGHEKLSSAHVKQADHHAEQADHHGNLAAHHGSQLEGAAMAEGVSSDAGHVEGVPTEEIVREEELLHTSEGGEVHAEGSSELPVEATSAENIDMPVEEEASMEEVVQ